MWVHIFAVALADLRAFQAPVTGRVPVQSGASWSRAAWSGPVMVERPVSVPRYAVPVKQTTPATHTWILPLMCGSALALALRPRAQLAVEGSLWDKIVDGTGEKMNELFGVKEGGIFKGSYAKKNERGGPNARFPNEELLDESMPDPVFDGPSPYKGRVPWGFSTFAEKLNGRAAMVGFTLLFLQELITGRGVLDLYGFGYDAGAVIPDGRGFMFWLVNK